MGRKSITENEELYKKMIALAKLGYSYEQISEMCDIGVGTASKKLRGGFRQK